MCLAVIALKQVAGFPVIVAANRDEAYERPTAPAAPWPQDGRIIGGRDLQAGGAWMAARADGRYALVTNVREPARHLRDAPSRGDLVRDFLLEDAPPRVYAERIAALGQSFNGFNLVVGSLEETWYCSNRGGPPRRLADGIHAVSNHLMDTPWPKVQRTRAAFSAALRGAPAPDIEAMLQALQDATPAPDDELPQTGVGLARERFLSSPFIASDAYGTRSSSVLCMGTQDIELHELRFGAHGTPAGRSDLRLPAAQRLL